MWEYNGRVLTIISQKWFRSHSFAINCALNLINYNLNFLYVFPSRTNGLCRGGAYSVWKFRISRLRNFSAAFQQAATSSSQQVGRVCGVNSINSGIPGWPCGISICITLAKVRTRKQEYDYHMSKILSYEKLFLTVALQGFVIYQLHLYDQASSSLIIWLVILKTSHCWR